MLLTRDAPDLNIRWDANHLDGSFTQFSLVLKTNASTVIDIKPGLFLSMSFLIT